MIAIVSRDEDLAQQIGGLIDDERKTYVCQATDEVELRHRIHSAQPSVVVLDLRFGGNQYRVIDQVPQLLETKSLPAIVAVIPWASKKVEREAARVGCYDVVNLDRRASLKRLVQSIYEASTARSAGALVRPPPPDPESFH